MGAYFLNLNRNKRSVVLDLKRPAAREALARLIAGADVFVHNMRPAAAARLGLDYATLGPRHPRLIHASASGFRVGSSRGEEPAYDDIIQGMSGMASLNGRAAGADGPRYVPMVMADKVSGTVLASAIGMALYARERTGRGQALHVPMLDTVLAFMLPEHLWGATFDDAKAGLGYTRMLTPQRRAVSDRGWSPMPDRRHGCAMGAAAAGDRAAGTDRRSAFHRHHGTQRQHRFRLWRGRGGAAAAHDRGMAAPTGGCRYSAWAGQLARGSAGGFLSVRNRVFPQ
jgi:hypothetical protein